MSVELPSCLDDYEPELILTVSNRRELIKGLAEVGNSSVEQFIKKHETDPKSSIAKLVRRLRKRLNQQVAMARERIEGKYRSRRQRLENEFERTFEPLESEESSDEQFSAIDGDIDSRLAEILSKDDTLNLIINLDDQFDESSLTLWERFKLALRRVMNYLKNLLRRFIAWLKRKFGKTKPETKPPPRSRRFSSILLNYPSGSKLWNKIDNRLDNALATNPKVQHTIERDLSQKGVKTLPSNRRVTWRGKNAEDDYKKQAREVVEQRIRKLIKHEQEKLMNQYSRKQRRIKQKLKDKKFRDKKRVEHESKLKQIEKQRQKELSKMNERYTKELQQKVKTALVNELEDAGYVLKGKNDDMKITSRLIDRFAEIVLSDELQKLPAKHSMTTGNMGNPHGLYEKKRLRMSAEISRMDIVDSLVNARISHPKQRHIYDSDITTHVDVRSTIRHVVLVFDKSGSMDEHMRIQAAKRAVLALFKAVKRKNPQNIVDFIAFDSTVQVMDMMQAWQCTPSGFTNTGEALATAHELLKDSRADYKLIYLITDGLPEAYTDKLSGRPRAGDLDKSLEIAVFEAKKLKKISKIKLTIILLEPKEDVYTDAANTIAKAAGGSVIVTDPSDLATEMLTDYIEI